MHLFSFADNHGVTRIASILQDKKQLDACTPCCSACRVSPACTTAASGAPRAKSTRETPLCAPCFEKPLENELTEFLGKLSRIKSSCVALKDGASRT